MTTPEVAHTFGGKPGQPPLIDGGIVQWFGWKDTARAAAAAIGWPMNSVWPVMTRFQHGWALKQEHGGFLTKTAYAELLVTSEATR